MIHIRKGEKRDVSELLRLIKELAAYEKAPNEVEVSVEELEKDGFGEKSVYEFFVAEVDGLIVGIALYYVKYSTWKGRCLYLDDIIVTEKMRRKGIGKLLFEEVMKVGKTMKVRKVEWQVLDWNEPAINFYKKYNTNFDEEWVNCKLLETQIKDF